MISNLIFDMGGVLIRWNPRKMLEAYHLTPEQEEILDRELFHSVEWIQMDRGTRSGEETVEAVCGRVPEALREAVRTLVLSWHQRYLEPVPQMAELLRELKGKGCRIYLLSNASTALRTYFPRIPGSECFEGLLVSAEEQLLKPSHEIYERLYEKFDLKPEECFFIDDSPANVEGALMTGMRGTVFYGDVSRLRRELRQVGIDCEE